MLTRLSCACDLAVFVWQANSESFVLAAEGRERCTERSESVLRSMCCCSAMGDDLQLAGSVVGELQ
jgi:hypothetical protein